MRQIKGLHVATLLGLFALAACDDSGTQLGIDELAGDQVELAILADPGAFDVAVELGATANDAAAAFGLGGLIQARTLQNQAGARFASATEALRIGDRRRALDESRRARRFLAESIYATGGADAVVALVERVEQLALEAAEDSVDFQNAPGLAEKLAAVAAEARAFLDAGEYVRAAERALLGEQIARLYRRNTDPQRAQLAVSLAATAVALADSLVASDSIPLRPIGTTDAREHMNRWLWHAHRMLEKAEQALANGNLARATHFAEHAGWSALKAVVLPGGVTDEELTAMVELAHELYAEAEIAVGATPTEQQALLLARADRLIQAGEQMISEGKKRGVALVWRGAVIASWLATA